MLKVKRWSKPAYALFAVLFIAIMCFALLPSPVQIGPLSFGGAGVAGATSVITAFCYNKQLIFNTSAPVPELAIGYGGGWGILEAMTDLSNVSPGSQIATYSDTGLPIGVYVVNPGTEAVSILVYYKDLQRDVSIGSRDMLYYKPPVGAATWIQICYLQEVAPPRWEQPTRGVVVPAGTKLLVPVVISIPGNATLDKPTYLALEFAQADEAMIMFRQQALFLIVPVPAASSPVIYMIFAGGLCVLVIAIYLFTLRRRRAR